MVRNSPRRKARAFEGDTPVRDKTLTSWIAEGSLENEEMRSQDCLSGAIFEVRQDGKESQ